MRREHDYMIRSEKRPGARQESRRSAPVRKKHRRRERHIGYAICTFLALLIVYPVGLILLWVPKLRWRGGTKLLISLATAPVFFVLLALALTAPSDDPMIVNAQTTVRTSMKAATETLSAHMPDGEQMVENLTVHGPEILTRTLEIGVDGARIVVPAVRRNVAAVLGLDGKKGLPTVLREKFNAVFGKGSPAPLNAESTLPPETVVYVVPGSGIYHLDPDCEVEGDVPMSKQQALEEGDEPCDLCVPMDLATPVPQITLTPRPTPIAVATLAPQTAEPVQPQASIPVGQPAQTIGPAISFTSSPTPTLSPQESPTPIPVVTPAALPAAEVQAPQVKPIEEIPVYYFDGSQYYHAKPDCGSMKNAPEHTLAEAVETGKKPCPWDGAILVEGTPEDLLVYCDANNVFHVTNECAAISGALTARPFEVAWMEDGMDGCKICGASALIDSAQLSTAATPVPAPQADHEAA